MKLIYICRHAKSSWDNLNLSDFDRPLNERGLKNAPLMANFLAEQKHAPQIVWSSPARRAITTAHYYMQKLPHAVLEEKEALYLMEYMELLHFICALPEDSFSQALVGHNPGLTNIINYLCGNVIGNLPTAGIACIQFDVPSWKEVSGDQGKLLWLETPKNLMKYN